MQTITIPYKIGETIELTQEELRQIQSLYIKDSFLDAILSDYIRLRFKND